MQKQAEARQRVTLGLRLGGCEKVSTPGRISGSRGPGHEERDVKLKAWLQSTF